MKRRDSRRGSAPLSEEAASASGQQKSAGDAAAAGSAKEPDPGSGGSEEEKTAADGSADSAKEPDPGSGESEEENTAAGAQDGAPEGTPDKNKIMAAGERTPIKIPDIPDYMQAEPLTQEEADAAAGDIEKIIDNVATVILGKREAIELVVLALLSEGHVLLEDVPGVGKTSLVSATAKSIDCGFSRIQFTPDLMPSDVCGFSVYNQKSGEFEFRPGGVMSNLVLADEINRASAKTQAALLEAMEEKQVTVDSHTYRLEEPFMVMATQNPIESFGTYPLPDAQLDRFLLKMSVGYLDLEEEARVILMPKEYKKSVQPVIGREDVIRLTALARRVRVEPMLSVYIAEIVAATRTSADTVLGSSPRGGIFLVNASRVYALMRGRAYVTPDDIQYLAPHILSHRITLTHEATVAGKTQGSIIQGVLQSVAVPTGEGA